MKKNKIPRKVLRIILIGLGAYVALIALIIIFSFPPLIGNHCLPDQLKGKLHEDFFFPSIRWIPRAATAFCFAEPPIKLLGNQNYWEDAKNGELGPKPIPPPGQWQLTVVQVKKGWPLYIPYFALTTKKGTHFRIGCRWDDADNYYVLPSIGFKL